MAPREGVLALEEEGAGHFEAHPHQRRVVDQHGSQRGDGGVQQRHLFPVGKIGPLRRADRRQTVEKERFGPGRLAWARRRKQGQRVLEPAGLDQRLDVAPAGPAAPAWRGEQDTDDAGENPAGCTNHIMLIRL